MKMLKIDLRRIPSVDRLANVVDRQFVQWYGRPGRPAVLEGLMLDWRAQFLWTKEFFASRYGKIECLAERQKHKGDFRTFKVAEYMKYMYSTRDKDPYYVRNWQLHLDHRELLSDYKVPSIFKSWLSIVPKSIAKEFPLFSWFYIGPKGSGTSMHLDVDYTSAWNAVISGRKLWLFYPPDQGDNLYNGLVDAFDPDLKRFPYFSKAKPVWQCIQGPGDIVFTPSGWWHQVVNLEPCISITENFINETNYAYLIDRLKKDGKNPQAGMYEFLADYVQRMKLTQKAGQKWKRHG